MQDVDSNVDYVKEDSMLVKIKQEPVLTCARYGAFYLLFPCSVLLNYVLFGFIVFFSSAVLPNVDIGFTEKEFETAPISPPRLDP